MTNINDGTQNGHYNRICGVPKPGQPDWVCSLSEGHRSPEHKAYRQHMTNYRSHFSKSWTGSAKSRSRARTGPAGQDEIAEALASIQATMQSRLPPKVVADRIAEMNTDLAKKYDGTSVSVQIHVQTDVKVELTEVIERLTLLRDSL